MCLCDAVCGVAPLTTFQALLAPTATQVLSRISVLAASVGSRRAGSTCPDLPAQDCACETQGFAVLDPMCCEGMGISMG